MSALATDRDATRRAVAGHDCPVQAAWAYANADSHEGAGFWLVLTMRSGQVIRGPALEPRNGIVAVQVYSEGVTALESEPPTFIRCADVILASVEW